MDLIDKIRKIEALIAGAKSEGERQAAELAKQRIQGKLDAQPIEYTVRLTNAWSKKLFVAICQKYRLRTYRYARQKYTTTMVFVSKPFMNDVLWPEFKKYSLLFEDLANEIMKDLASKIHQVQEDDEVIISGDFPDSKEAATL